MDADETNPHGLHHGYGKEVDVWSLGCVAGEILRNAHEAHKVLFGKDDRFRKYATGNRRVQFGILERYIQTDNHFRVDIVYQLLHIDPQRRLILDKIPTHPFFAFWLMEKPRFPKGKAYQGLLSPRQL
ncbi:hypothetical protein FA13DRAFT_1158541 [Coprinellus micaceus]|uniref:Protein kinase domain-containing protein n=1 Tax=Coprinellus micaceus TaxID=71717 RepID=A0A4Y7SUG4_COPMI|nr:hypothetical protein FA13DRAFT_1158541 [Coprinellus micaceus]